MKYCPRCGNDQVHSHGTHLPDSKAATPPIADEKARKLVEVMFTEWATANNIRLADYGFDDLKRRITTALQAARPTVGEDLEKGARELVADFRKFFDPWQIDTKSVEDEVTARIAAFAQAAADEREVKWATPKGEDATGYNAGIYRDVYNDVVGPRERERLQKLDDSPSRRRNYAKESTWQSQLVHSLVQRIMNLRLMLAASKAAADAAREDEREACAVIAEESEKYSADLWKGVADLLVPNTSAMKVYNGRQLAAREIANDIRGRAAITTEEGE